MKIIIILLLSISTNIFANGWASTQEIYNACNMLDKASKEPEKMTQMEFYIAGQCEGFFMGFRDGEYTQYLTDNKDLDLEKAYNEFYKRRAWCEPKDTVITLGQRYKMFLKYVNEHPEDMHKSAFLTVVKAMKPHFPCDK